MFNSYFHAIQFLESFSNIPQPDYMKARRRSDFYLQRSAKLIQNLNIDLNKFQFIHIAGTSGKGSTVAAIHEILRQAGYKVGSYYSPHTTTTIERIKVNGHYISPRDFVDILNIIKPILARMLFNDPLGSPSYFETLLAIALLYYQKTGCRYVILETGCGGEFDATNIIPRPLVTAITNIGLDHTEILGKTLAKIATTKAGIIKPRSAFFTMEKRPHLLKIFQKICQQKKAKFIPVNPDQSSTSLSEIKNNFILAANICHYLNIEKKYIDLGLNSMFIPCRFETVQKKPLVILDGAHNPDKINFVIANLRKMSYLRLFLIIAINADKDFKTMIKNIAPLADVVHITRHLAGERPCADLKLMYNQFLDANKKITTHIFLDPWQALSAALTQAKSQDAVLITGSFYLAGELRKQWISEEQILHTRTSAPIYRRNAQS